MSIENNPYLGRNNPYLENMVNDAQSDVVRNWNTAVQPAYNSAMVKSGSFGNAGVQQMNDNAALTTQKALGSISTNLRGQDFRDQQNMYQWDTGMDRNIYNDAYSQNMNNLTTGMGLIGSLSGFNTSDINNSTTQQNTPLNYWGQFNNAANSLGQGYGTSTGSSTMGTSSSPIASALGGAQLGSAAMGWWNKYNNGNSGSGTSQNVGESYLPSGYDALGFPNGQ